MQTCSVEYVRFVQKSLIWQVDNVSIEAGSRSLCLIEAGGARASGGSTISFPAGSGTEP